jgi:two-component system, OmpR family, response regulator RstA
MMQRDTTKLLLIEDDNKFARLVSDYLQPFGYLVHHAENGELGLTKTREINPQLIILDLMMPVMDGLSVCRELQGWYRGRVIVLTASDEEMDEVACLEMGADDFVSKPVHPRVLLARVRALLRRDVNPVTLDQGSNELDEAKLQFGQLTLQHNQRRTYFNGTLINLTESEFALLWVLASHPEQPLSRDFIMKALRGIEHDGLDRSIDNRIVSLRKKLDDSKGLPKRIITIRGKGYLFVSDQW